MKGWVTDNSYFLLHHGDNFEETTDSFGNLTKQSWQDENPHYYNAATWVRTHDLLLTKRHSDQTAIV